MTATDRRLCDTCANDRCPYGGKGPVIDREPTDICGHYVPMTATDELRRMLDEHGVEYEAPHAGFTIVRTSNLVCKYYETLEEPERGVFAVANTDWLTPEQAIAATLGPGTCHVESSIIDTYEYNRWEYELSCGHTIIWEDSEPPNYCPECGRRIVQ